MIDSGDPHPLAPGEDELKRAELAGSEPEQPEPAGPELTEPEPENIQLSRGLVIWGLIAIAVGLFAGLFMSALTFFR